MFGEIVSYLLLLVLAIVIVVGIYVVLRVLRHLFRATWIRREQAHNRTEIRKSPD